MFVKERERPLFAWPKTAGKSGQKASARGAARARQVLPKANILSPRSGSGSYYRKLNFLSGAQSISKEAASALRPPTLRAQATFRQADQGRRRQGGFQARYYMGK